MAALPAARITANRIFVLLPRPLPGVFIGGDAPGHDHSAFRHNALVPRLRKLGL